MPSTTARRLDWTRDELILVCDVVLSRGWKTVTEEEEETGRLSALLRELPIYPAALRADNFRSRASVRRKSVNLVDAYKSHVGGTQVGGTSRSNYSRLDLKIVQEFAAEPDRMCQAAKLIRARLHDGEFKALVLVAGVEPDGLVEDEELGVAEGRLLARLHLTRERNRALRDKKVAEVRAMSGRLACEVCGFDFEARYGERGKGFIECHHRVPLHAGGPAITRLEDLILICANCHRMIHHGPRWLTPDELRAMLIS